MAIMLSIYFYYYDDFLFLLFFVPVLFWGGVGVLRGSLLGVGKARLVYGYFLNLATFVTFLSRAEN